MANFIQPIFLISLLLPVYLAVYVPTESPRILSLSKDAKQDFSRRPKWCLSRAEMAIITYSGEGYRKVNNITSQRVAKTIKLSGMKSGDKVLDLGTGHGDAAFAAKAEVGPSGKVVAVDIVDEAVRVARQNAIRLGHQIHFDVADINTIEPLLQRLRTTFDVIICVSTFSGIEDPAKTLAIWARFLKPRGRIVFNIQPLGIMPDLGAIDEAALELGVPTIMNREAMIRESPEEIIAVATRAGLVAHVEKGEEENQVPYLKPEGAYFIRQWLKLPFYGCTKRQAFIDRALSIYSRNFNRQSNWLGIVWKSKFTYYVVATKPGDDELR